MEIKELLKEKCECKVIYIQNLLNVLFEKYDYSNLYQYVSKVKELIKKHQYTTSNTIYLDFEWYGIFKEGCDGILVIYEDYDLPIYYRLEDCSNFGEDEVNAEQIDEENLRELLENE